MVKGLTINHRRHTSRLIPLRGVWSRLLIGRRQRRRLHGEIHRLRQEIARLRGDNRALAERNESVERLSSDLMRFNLDLSQVSRLDPMTGLLNRAAFEACLNQEHALAENARDTHNLARPYSVIMIDVDHFKAYNDALGHPEGDRCLVQIAGAIQDTVRRTDSVGRYGGEEFIVLCPGLDTEHAAGLAERLRQAVRRLAIPHPANSAGSEVTISLGLATGGTLTRPAENAAAVVLAADQMLYQAKHAGRNRVSAA